MRQFYRGSSRSVNADFFEANRNAGAVLFNLTAAYDTVAPWLYLQTAGLLPDEHIVKIITEPVRIRSFNLTTSQW